MRASHQWVVAAAVSLGLCASASSTYAGSDSGSQPAPLESARQRLEHIDQRVERLEAERLELAAQVDRARAIPDEARVKRALEAGARLVTELEAADTARREARRAFASAAEREISRLDAEMRALVPALGGGPIEERRAAAFAIRDLRDRRRALHTELSTLDATERGRWGEPTVGVNPLDGPEELAEKADFLADARDKLLAKQAALQRLLEDARVGARVRRSARSLALEASLFDEDARLGRVTRGSPEATLAGTTQEGPAEGASVGTDGSRTDATEASAAPAQGVGALDPSDGLASGGALNTDGSAFAGSDAVDDAIDTPTPAPSAPALDIPTAQRDLGALLELDPAVIEGGSADPEALEALVRRLERVERALSKDIAALRARARGL